MQPKVSTRWFPLFFLTAFPQSYTEQYVLRYIYTIRLKIQCERKSMCLHRLKR